MQQARAAHFDGVMEQVAGNRNESKEKGGTASKIILEGQVEK
jgi:hypothetical protein